MYRYTTPGIIRAVDPFLIWKMKNEKDRTLYLTFDDGPHPTITPWVLEILKKYQAKATFFCVGENVRKYPEVYQRILNEGHQVGNHTNNHLNGWNNPNDHYYGNIETCSETVSSKLFRPPYGKITPAQAIHLRKKGFRIVMWSILSRDFQVDLNLDESLQAIIDESETGHIIVFHDSEKSQANLEYLLPRYLNHFSQEGFQFDIIDL
ncbi:MAG: polysaccharide deacetylase family protein [Bacteroidetes bacterium]|nr:polysaccharide deacetylase family protein [Bacteroidota bacterium]